MATSDLHQTHSQHETINTTNADEAHEITEEDRQAGPGRPLSNVEVARVRELLDLGFPITYIANDIGVSRKTLYHHMSLAGIQTPSERYHQVSDEVLLREISEIKARHPNCGVKYLIGHLRSKGLKVQRRRIEVALRGIDPAGVMERRTRTTVRRQYSVPCPNYLWHIDGDHKLVHWKFVVHAGIDGFSRNIVFLDCSTNNLSATVSRLFFQAVEQYGWPIRIRTDYGSENVEVWDAMNHHRGHEARSVITGPSVHNERVERLHREVNEQVLNVFKSIFLEMEGEGLLNRSNDTDLFCLHYVFLPRIRRHLQEFRRAHNHHPISTEGNRSPIQLFHESQHLIALHENVSTNDPHLGLTAEELTAFRELTHVEVSHIASPLTQQQFRELEQTVDPLADQNPSALFTQVAEYVLASLT